LQSLRDAASRSGTFHGQEGYSLCTTQPDLWVPVSLTVSRLHVKPKTLALLTARDAREQRQAQARLREAAAAPRRLGGAGPDCLWSGDIDPSGRIVYGHISPAVARIAGQPPEFFLEGMSRWWGVIHPQDRRRWEEAVVRLRFAGSAREEYRVVWPDGTVRWVR